MLAAALFFVVGDCHIDATETQCERASRYGLVVLLFAPLSGIATFFLIRWLVGQRK
jgi:hypothetical protein